MVYFHLLVCLNHLLEWSCKCVSMCLFDTSFELFQSSGTDHHQLFCGIGTFIDGEPIINLPPKTVRLAKVDFSPEERAFYSKLEADSRSQFKVLFFLCIFLALLHFLASSLQEINIICMSKRPNCLCWEFLSSHPLLLPT